MDSKNIGAGSEKSGTTANLKSLPRPNDKILSGYQQLVRGIDQAMTNLIGERSFKLQCEPGCSQCCIPFSVLPLEAAIILKFIKKNSVDGAVADGKCIMLNRELCQIYTVRPLICRTQGMPIGYIDEERGVVEVSACHLNFPPEYPLEEGDLLFMDEFNSRLAALNREYCEKNGLDPARRIPLDQLL